MGSLWRVVAQRLDPKAIKRGDLVIGRLVTVEDRESCADTVRLMVAKDVRQMSAVNAAGALVGIVIVDDLLPPRATRLSESSQLAAQSREHELSTRKWASGLRAGRRASTRSVN